MRWKEVPLRSLIVPNNKRNRPDLPLLSVVREEGIIKRKLDRSDNHNVIPDDLSSYKVVSTGQFVINKMKAWQGSCGVSPYEGIVSPAYFVFDLNIDNPRFFNYSIRSKVFVDEFNRISKGIRVGQWDLELNLLKYVRFPLPPRDEQDQIVRYLDWKVSQVNRLVNAKRRVVELLQEQIDVLVYFAIANPQRKVRLKHVVEVVRNWIERDNFLLYSPIGVLNRGRGVFHKEQLMGADLGTSEFFSVEPHVLMISGQFAWERAVAITTEKEKNCIASHRYYTVRGIRAVCKTEYLWAFFQTKLGDTILNSCSHGAAGRNRPLNFNEMLNEYIPMPAIEIQEKIARYVETYLKFRAMVKSGEKLIAEYRTRLISDAVTGKMDVRGIAVPFNGAGK